MLKMWGEISHKVGIMSQCGGSVYQGIRKYLQKVGKIILTTKKVVISLQQHTHPASHRTARSGWVFFLTKIK